jgi:diguanylate cyclase (GGDEF)-like protein
MPGTRIAYEKNGMSNNQALLKIDDVFKSIQSSIDAIKTILETVHEVSASFPQFDEDVKSIVAACALFTDLLEKERVSVTQKMKSGELTEDHMKEVRHDLRAKIGAIIGYSELIQEDLADDEKSDAAEQYTHTLNSIVEQAKQLIPIIDGLRVEGALQEEVYSTNENDYDMVPGAESNMSYGEQYAHCTVLIIDDSAYNREILSRRLSRYGVNVTTADNGAKGLDMVLSQSVDLVLLDIMMPVMNGYEVLTQLKSDAKTKNIPVLMISALSEVDSIVRCIEAGAEDYLPTPFNPVVLHARIKACLEKKILRDREQENLDKLELARQKLETAIESIDDGFAVLDKDTRLTISNSQFQKLYPGVEKLGFHGFTYEELLRENIGLDVYFSERRSSGQQAETVQEKENWVKLYGARQRSSETYLIRLHDGRWIEVVNSKTPDGGQVSVHKDVTDRKEDEERLTFLALHDPLTGLSNRSAFEAILNATFITAKETNANFAIMFLDLDGFKGINDTYGHEVGDRVLMLVSEALKKSVRTGDVVARLGGDEFAIILTASSTKDNICIVADRVLKMIDDRYVHNGKPLTYGISIGIACYPEDGDTTETMLINSDVAMYTAKKSGKGHYRFFSDIEKS